MAGKKTKGGPKPPPKNAKKKVAKKVAKKDTCFTIMPFGGWFDTYYESIYCPAIEAAGLTPRRADDLMRPSTIVHDIWACTREAKIILADLTGQNPNVFYELGLAHAVAKPAILLTEALNDVPFDLRALRVIEFNKSAPNWGALLQAQIQQALEEVLEAPLESVLPAFLNVTREGAKPAVTEHQRELLEMRQDIERLRNEVTRRQGIWHRPQRLASFEAREIVSRYLADGMPTHRIVDVMERRYAVPAGWVIRLIKDLTDQMKLPLDPPPRKQREAKAESVA